jgi:Tfp pilus assembly protein PilN
MKPIHIEFAPPTLRRAWYRLHPALLALGAAAALLCLGAALAGWQVAQLQRQRLHQAEVMRERQAAVTAVPAKGDTSPIPQAQVAAVNEAIMQLNLPWRALQDAVAAATPRGVALVALEPDPRKRVLKISAETRTGDEMIAYVEALKQQELFGSVLLTHHEINERDPSRPLRFELEATWMAR